MTHMGESDNPQMALYFVVRGAPHPFSAPDYPDVQIVGWHFGSSTLEAATAVAERDQQHDYYTAYRQGGGEDARLVLYVPGEGVDPDPPSVAIG